MLQAFDGSVVEVNVTHGKSTLGRNGFRIDLITVILRCHVYPSVSEVFHRMVCATVTKGKSAGRRSDGKPQNLMAEADAQ